MNMEKTGCSETSPYKIQTQNKEYNMVRPVVSCTFCGASYKMGLFIIVGLLCS